jgi:hypothetical protein
LTWEKRRCHAVRIGKGGGKRRSPSASLRRHGREWQPWYPCLLRDASVRAIRLERSVLVKSFTGRDSGNR